MSTYAEQIQAIRDARKKRGDASRSLYGLQLGHRALKKALKKSAAGELPHNDKLEAAISAAREKIAKDQQELLNTQQSLQQIALDESALAELKERKKRLDKDADGLKSSLQPILEELQMDVSDERKEELLLKKKSIEQNLEAVGQKQKELSKAIEEGEKKVHEDSARKNDLQKKEEAQNAAVEKEKEKLSGLIKGQEAPNNSGNLEQSAKGVRKGIDELKDARIDVSKQIGILFQRTPQELIEEWEDDRPILMLPLRIETKFQLSGSQKELWVRVFPDDIFIVTHEPVLTKTEVDYGTAYWKALWMARDAEDKKKEAWRMIADKFGANRAAWVATSTKPINWKDASTLNSEDELQFPAIDLTKTDSWTEAPHTPILPDKFVLLAYRGGTLVAEKIGNQLDDIVQVGPSPMEDEDNPGITRSAGDNRIEMGEELKWLSDFEVAVRKGLGFKLALDATSAAQGFDQLLVLGLKLSADENDGQQLLEGLLDNHHYSKNGLSLLPQGTPTNNTDNREAGFSSKDPLQSLSYFTETGNPMFTPTDDAQEACDGQRLAEYLGIEYGPLQYIQNSDRRDYTEAIAMNKALYSGTLGYFLHSMLNEVMEDSYVAKLRHFFNNSVTGRGPVAAIRVGNQPYGILPTSSFAGWSYKTSRVAFSDPFYSNVHAFLSFLETKWAAIIPALSHISKKGDAAASLMNVLGLQPTSAAFFQRVGYSFDSIKNQESFQSGGSYFWDIFKIMWEQYTVTPILESFGYERKNGNTTKPVPLLLQLIFQHYHTLLDAKNLIDGEPFQETKGIKPYDAALNKNYIHWLLETNDPKKLQTEDFGGAPAPKSLLYMMLRHALILESSEGIYHYLKNRNIDGPELIRSRKFVNITPGPSISQWEVFRAPVETLVPGEGIGRNFFEHIALLSAPADKDIAVNIQQHQWALDVLKDLPTARLERLLSEHLDLLTYRLDAWQTAMFDQRLRAQRGLGGATASRKKGTYIGAYGYLEMVQPSAGKRTKIAEDILPESLREGKDNLFQEQDNGGYVHGPTLNHATAAAILRNGYLSHASPGDKELMAVNLSSERVRRAKYLIEGVRNGQSLEVLLGYQFERGLHDWSTRAVNPVILNQLIPDFRKRYPIKKTKLPQQGNVTGPEETIEDYHVTNGMDLAASTEASPYINVVPALSAAQINAIQKEKENIANTLDAMRDVLVSESAYQLALGNFDRASSVLQSVSNSQLPPDIEVINSVRGTSLAFTNRVAVQFDVEVTANPWPGINRTQRARTEPAMNHWLGGLLGDPANIVCFAKAVDSDGAVLTRPDSSNVEGFVTLADLNVQPLDFIYLVRNKLEESGASELEARVRYSFARTNLLSDDTIVKIEFANAGVGAGARSFADVLPFANYLRELLSGSSALGARSFEISSKKLVASTDNPDQYNVTELKARAAAVALAFTPLFAQLSAALGDAKTLKTASAIDALRTSLQQIADNGIVYAFPQSAAGSGDDQLEVLTAQADALLSRYELIKSRYAEKLTVVNTASTKPPLQVEALTEMIRMFLGDDYVVLPHFSFTNLTEVSESDGARNELLEYATNTKMIPFPVDEWLHGVSVVRPKMHLLEMVRLLNDSFSDQVLELSPMQLPYRKDDSWMAIEYPAGMTADHDTISFVQYLPQGFDASKDQCGLLLDQWTEAVPNKEEVTGICFNYNQPNSAPPQAILLAVTPEETGHWKWDHLVNTVLDTFKRARQRAVEPDQLDAQGGITMLFPALISEFSTSRNNVSLDYSLNIASVFLQVEALQINKS